MVPLGERFTKEELKEYKTCVQLDLEKMKNCHEDLSLSASVNQNGLEGHKMSTPDYYESRDNSEITCIDAIKSAGYFEDFCKACIMKYTWRAGKKRGMYLEDIDKIIDYAQMLREFVDKEYE